MTPIHTKMCTYTLTYMNTRRTDHCGARVTDDDGLVSLISSMMSYQCNTIKAQKKKDAAAFVDELLLLSTKYHNLSTVNLVYSLRHLETSGGICSIGGPY